MTLFSLCDCFSQWKLECETAFKGFSWCWWGRQRYFGAVLGLTDVFLVSHIKVGAKYNFSSGARTQAGTLRSWVGGHVATMRSDRFDLQEMIPRLRCNCGGSSNGEIMQLRIPAGPLKQSERGCVCSQICNIICKHIRAESNVCCSSALLSPAFPAGFVPSPWPDSLLFLCLVEQEVGPESGGTRPQRPSPEQGGIWREESSCTSGRGREQERQEPARVS